MSGRFVLSPLAQADIDTIWVGTVRMWGSDQAETYIRQINQHIKTIAAQPTIGRECPEVRAGYRKYHSGSHVLFYRLTDAGIDIVRVLHKRMDFRQHV